MIISSEFNSRENLLIASYYNEDGLVEYIKKRLPDEEIFNWKITSNPTGDLNWDGRYIEKAGTKWMSRFRIEELIQSKFNEQELTALYSEHRPKKWYSDIEIWLTKEDEFPSPDLAEERVSLITCIGDSNLVYVLSTMGELTDAQQDRMMKYINGYISKYGQTFTLKYINYEKEVDMLRSFFHKMLPKMPFLTGWNYLDFDWKYLVNRAKNLGIDPAGALTHKRFTGKALLPSHLGLLDYMEVFMNLKPYKVIENYKLNNIADLVLGLKKLQHTESMIKFQQQTEKYIAYNIIDTILVKLIDDKLQLLDVAFEISRIAQVDVNKVFSSVYIGETLLCREFLRRNRKLAAIDKRSIEDSTYAGAYVSKPKPGWYKYVSCNDFASMYPNLQIQFNISPDTYLGKINQLGEEEVLSNIWTKNNTVFNNKIDSASRTILTVLYDTRVSTKGEMKVLKKEMEKDVQMA